jgi:hypothetical protein
MGNRDENGPDGLLNARRRMGPGDGYADDDVSGHGMPEIPGAGDGFAATPRLPGRDRVAAEEEDDVEGHIFASPFLGQALDAAARPGAGSRTVTAPAAEDDTFVQVLWRARRAKALERAGDTSGARSVAREAVRFAQGSDLIVVAADALVDVARLLQLAGRGREAASIATQAAETFERNGNPALAARARRLATEASPA